MSIFWDPRKKKPQVWIAPFFILIAIVLAVGVYQFGLNKAKQKEANSATQEK